MADAKTLTGKNPSVQRVKYISDYISACKPFWYLQLFVFKLNFSKLNLKYHQCQTVWKICWVLPRSKSLQSYQKWTKVAQSGDRVNFYFIRPKKDSRISISF